MNVCRRCPLNESPVGKVEEQVFKLRNNTLSPVDHLIELETLLRLVEELLESL